MRNYDTGLIIDYDTLRTNHNISKVLSKMAPLIWLNTRPLWWKSCLFVLSTSYTDVVSALFQYVQTSKWCSGTLSRVYPTSYWTSNYNVGSDLEQIGKWYCDVEWTLSCTFDFKSRIKLKRQWNLNEQAWSKILREKNQTMIILHYPYDVVETSVRDQSDQTMKSLRYFKNHIVL